MASDLISDSIPTFYREVYQLLCPTQELKIDKDIFVKLLAKSSLTSQQLNAIWDLVDSKQGYLTRNGLYKALALTAHAQQGKQINEKLLEHFSGQELPKPLLGDLSELKYRSNRLRWEKNPSDVCFTYQELCAMDNINVNIIPEKKGLFLKHVEYQVTSEMHKSSVRRRYNDFVLLYEMLLLRFPYRAIPHLPPKKLMGADSVFMEERRRALKRFLTVICRHPVVAEDKIVHFFLTFNGQDMQSKIKDTFKNLPDECVTNELALKSKELIPVDPQNQFVSSREHLKQMHATINRLKEIADRMVSRSLANASDMQDLGKELSIIASERMESAWVSSGSEAWSSFKKILKKLSTLFPAVSQKLSEQAANEENGVCENLNLLLDLMVAYKDLCDRHEKGFLQDHQRASSKMSAIKRKMAQVSVKGTDAMTADQLESRLLEQENQILNIEIRSYFSLYCIHLETQLVYLNMEILQEVIQELIATQADGHASLSRLWEQMKGIEALSKDSAGRQKNCRSSSPIA